jgi:hypothetical protein
MIDGDLTTSWESRPGSVGDQRITIELNQGKLWRLASVLIDPAATNGDPKANDVARFSVLVSSTGLPQADFHRVLAARCKAVNRLIKFSLPKGTVARYVQLLAQSNHGGNRIAIDEFEVYGRPSTRALTDEVAGDGAVAAGSRAGQRVLKRASPLASVRAIIKGLTEQPPHQKQRRGHVRDPLQTQYGLQTLRAQKAAVAFRDGTTLQIASQTSLVLRDPHITAVNSGKVEELVAPGSDHRVQTAAAVASAVGTRFIVIVHRRHIRHRGKKPTIKIEEQVIVIEGAVRVRTKHASVLVKTGQETTIQQGQKPSKPKRDPSLAGQSAFTGNLPNPPLPENIALDSNGGRIISGPPA